MSSLPNYLAYVGTAVALLAGFTALYTFVTPYREFALIRQGNKAAAVSLGGTLIGFGIVLCSAAAHSVSLGGMAMWAAVAMAFQLGVFYAATLLLRGFRAGIEAGEESYGLTLAALSITMGLINAGAIT